MSTRRSLRSRSAAILAAGLLVAGGSAEAKNYLVSPERAEVGIHRGGIASVKGLRPQGEFLVADLEVNFHCDAWEWVTEGAVVSTFDDRLFDFMDSETPVELQGFSRHKRGVPFGKVPVARIDDMVTACRQSGGDTTLVEADLLLFSICCPRNVLAGAAPGTLTGVKLPIEVRCSEVLPAGQRRARVSVASYRYSCPDGFVIEGTRLRSGILPADPGPGKMCVRL